MKRFKQTTDIARERFQTFQQTQKAQEGLHHKLQDKIHYKHKQLHLQDKVLDSFQPFIADNTSTDALIKQQAGIAGAEAMLGSSAGTGTGSIQDFMSPFQQQVIDATLAEFERLRAQQEEAIKDQQAAIRCTWCWQEQEFN